MKKFDTDDILIIAGGLMVSGGIGWIYWPAALIIVGLTFVYLGVRGGRIGGKRHG